MVASPSVLDNEPDLRSGQARYKGTTMSLTLNWGEE